MNAQKSLQTHNTLLRPGNISAPGFAEPSKTETVTPTLSDARRFGEQDSIMASGRRLWREPNRHLFFLTKPPFSSQSLLTRYISFSKRLRLP
jgi:hypothetical protein